MLLFLSRPFPCGLCLSRGTSVFLFMKLSLVTKWLNFEWVCGSVWTVEVAVCGYLMVTSSTCQDCESVWDVLVSRRGCSMCLMFCCEVDMENKVATWYRRPSCVFVCLAGLMCSRGTLNSQSHVGMVWSQLQHWLSHACCEPRPTEIASDLVQSGLSWELWVHRGCVDEDVDVLMVSCL